MGSYRSCKLRVVDLCAGGPWGDRICGISGPAFTVLKYTAGSGVPFVRSLRSWAVADAPTVYRHPGPRISLTVWFETELCPSQNPLKNLRYRTWQH